MKKSDYFKIIFEPCGWMFLGGLLVYAFLKASGRL